jgi:hypothetical protein
MKHTLTLFFFVFILNLSLNAQEVKDSIDVIKPSIMELDESDTVRIQSHAQRFNPTKASLYAAVLPGLGQVYNKKYWKLPLVYGGMFAAGYAINYYQGLYKDYKSQLFYILETGAEESEEGFRESQIRPAMDQARRDRGLCVGGVGGG